MSSPAAHASTSPSGTESRRAAIFVLGRWLESRDFPDRLLPSGPDRGFVMDMVYGTVRGWRRLEWVLERFVPRKPSEEVRAALLIGVQQLLFMPDVADYAAIHATVEAAKIGSPRSAGFVNAVLRNVLRQRDTLLSELERQPLAVRTSHPDELVSRWTLRYGAAETEALCSLDNQPAQTVLACLPSGPGASEVARQAEAAGVATASHPADPDCLVVQHGVAVEAIPGYAEGWFVPQDAATLQAVRLLDVKPGLRVLDGCAAPGGKTVQIAARMQGQGVLLAMDLHADRLPPLRANLTRLGMEWVTVLQGDAGDPAILPGEPAFDRILLDVPCSNTGVLRRRPDARWRFFVKRLRTLQERQVRLLLSMLPRLAAGGRLVYSTCSLEPEENQEVVARACAERPEFHVIASHERIPTRDGTDGAFAAAIVRR